MRPEPVEGPSTSSGHLSRVQRVGTGVGWLVFAAFTAVQVHIAVRLPGGPAGLSDLRLYTGAVETAVGGGSLYDFRGAGGIEFVYPPFAVVVFLPFAVVSDLVAGVAWTLLQCTAVLALAWLVVARSPLTTRLSRPLALPVVAGVLMLTYPVFSGIFLGQVSLLVILLALLDAVDLTPLWCRGVATGLAAAIKLTPLVFVPYLWLTGRRRAALVATATFVVATAGGWLVDGADSRRYWASVGAARPYIDLGQRDNASLSGLLTRVDGAGLVGLLLLAPVVLALALWSYRRATAAYRSGERLAGAVVVGALVVLVSPISWSHHQVALVLAAACLVRGRPAWATAWSVGVLVLTSIPVQAVLLHVGSPAPLLRESGVLLALAIAVLVPFGQSERRCATSGQRNGSRPARPTVLR